METTPEGLRPAPRPALFPASPGVAPTTPQRNALDSSHTEADFGLLGRRLHNSLEDLNVLDRPPPWSTSEARNRTLGNRDPNAAWQRPRKRSLMGNSLSISPAMADVPAPDAGPSTPGSTTMPVAAFGHEPRFGADIGVAEAAPLVGPPLRSPLIATQRRAFTSPPPSQVGRCASPPSLSREVTPALPAVRRIDDPFAQELRVTLLNLCCRMAKMEDALARSLEQPQAARQAAGVSAVSRVVEFAAFFLRLGERFLRPHARKLTCLIIVGLCLLLLRPRR